MLNAFSAHADYKDILEYVQTVDRNQLKEIFLVHGEPEAQTSMKKLLEEKSFKTSIVKYGEKYEINV